MSTLALSVTQFSSIYHPLFQQRYSFPIFPFFTHSLTSRIRRGIFLSLFRRRRSIFRIFLWEQRRRLCRLCGPESRDNVPLSYISRPISRRKSRVTGQCRFKILPTFPCANIIRFFFLCTARALWLLVAKTKKITRTDIAGIVMAGNLDKVKNKKGWSTSAISLFAARFLRYVFFFFYRENVP